MNIGFDAKRAFQNRTGLGNYSRTLIRSLGEYYPQYNYFLFAPKAKSLFQPPSGMQTILPERRHHRWLKSVWRSRWVINDLVTNEIDLYHGLSAELPFGISNSGVQSVVTMHDLIFERYPKQYNPIDVYTYRKKARYACKRADKIIAISEQTKQDLIEFYHTPENRITVCYQSCDPSFEQLRSKEEIAKMLAHYQLPDTYFLYVGSVIERKNLMGIVKAMRLLKGKLNIPLVVLGDGDRYKEEVKAFLQKEGMASQLIWLNEVAKFSFKDLPALYQGAVALIYPSIFEGFGIPILEALWSRTPVITANVSCFRETAGDAALYIDPYLPATMAEAMETVAIDRTFAAGMQERGLRHAQQFTPDKCAAAVMAVYQS